jgi:hypothetical protein
MYPIFDLILKACFLCFVPSVGSEKSRPRPMQCDRFLQQHSRLLGRSQFKKNDHTLLACGYGKSSMTITFDFHNNQQPETECMSGVAITGPSFVMRTMCSCKSKQDDPTINFIIIYDYGRLSFRGNRRPIFRSCRYHYLVLAAMLPDYFVNLQFHASRI